MVPSAGTSGLMRSGLTGDSGGGATLDCAWLEAAENAPTVPATNAIATKRGIRFMAPSSDRHDAKGLENESPLTGVKNSSMRSASERRFLPEFAAKSKRRANRNGAKDVSAVAAHAPVDRKIGPHPGTISG